MPKRKQEKGVSWYLPGKKRPVTHSTKAASDLIVVMAQEHDTVQEIHDAIVYDAEARAVLQHFIDAGFGALVLRDSVS